YEDQPYSSPVLAASRRQAIHRQVAKIDEIMERSNKTLLHIESNNKALALPQNTTLSPQETPSSPPKVFNVKPECEVALVRILDNFKRLVQSSDHNENTYSALDGCLAHRHRVEHLGSSVRKLVALCDTVAQMRSFQEAPEAVENSI
ncbi:hypothetical protein KR009_006251, partial [Drosophila setifemur]